MKSLVFWINFLISLLVGSIWLILTQSCATLDIGSKSAPEYDSIPKALKPEVDGFLKLAKDRKITFKNQVTIGFTDINEGDVVGLCHYGGYFREVDIDRSYWKRATSLERLVLVRHELTHCYCQRGHDWGNGHVYELISPYFTVKSDLELPGPYTRNNGFYEDGCPISIMYPSILSDDCTKAHFGDYEIEMLDNCRAY
jgi:hypothetical protein